MIFNFDVEIGGALYDCDAQGDMEGGIDLLEIRLVNEDGSSFVVVKREDVPDEVLVKLAAEAGAERELQLEGWLERQAEHPR